MGKVKRATNVPRTPNLIEEEEEEEEVPVEIVGSKKKSYTPAPKASMIDFYKKGRQMLQKAPAEVKAERDQDSSFAESPSGKVHLFAKNYVPKY